MTDSTPPRLELRHASKSFGRVRALGDGSLHYGRAKCMRCSARTARASRRS